jgi:hypothetical protein
MTSSGIEPATFRRDIRQEKDSQRVKTPKSLVKFVAKTGQ